MNYLRTAVICLWMSGALWGQFGVTTTSPLPNGTVGKAYSQQLAATSGFATPYTWTVTGTLPPGLTFITSGLLSGTPTGTGTFVPVFTATTAPGGNQQTTPRKQLSITVSLAPLTITTTSLNGGNLNASYSQSVTASGGQTPYGWSAMGLPTGLAIDSTSGTISGTPTQPGNFTVSITVVDSAKPQNTAAGRFTLSISSNLRITTTSISNPMVGIAYQQALSASGGVSPLTWDISSGSLPSGLSINTTTGTIGGTPSVPTTYTFTVKVTDAQQSTATQTYTVMVTTPITFLTMALGNGVLGTPYSQQINATGGAPPIVLTLAANPFGTSSLPPGLTLSTTGAVTGTPTTAGSYTAITVVATDSLKNTGTMTYAITITSPQAPLSVSPGSLAFSANAGGDSPASQIITVLAAGTAPATFSVTADGGQSGIAAPPWLKVTPTAGTTPSVLTVTVDPSGLSAGTFTGRVVVGGTAVTVNLAVTATAPSLSLSPTFLRYPARIQNPGLQDRYIRVRNSGGSGAESFSVTTPDPIPWLDSITPNSGQTSPNNPVYVRVRVNTNGLAVGGYKGVIRFTYGTSTIDVRISVFVNAAGPILDVDQTGLRFEARQGQGTGAVKTVQVLNAGDPGTTVNFTATIANSANWLTISPATGTATTSQPGLLQLSINSNSQSLASGGYYALVQITDANSHNSPQYVVVVLDVGDSTRPVMPDASPQGLLFTAAGTQPVNVGVSSSSTVNFSASAATTDGAAWLTVSPAAGTISSASSAKLSVATNLTGLKAGVYTGLVNIAIGSQVAGINVTLILPAGTGAAALSSTDTSGACTPTRVVLTQTGLATNFMVPAGWPASLSMAVYDDCANALSSGSVLASFSNGDPPLSLHPGAPGLFSATWQSANPTGDLTINVTGSSGTLQPASAQITGGVTPNVAPVLYPNGTLNNFYAESALSPGLIAQVYGSGMASGVGQPNTLPLPGSFQGTSVMVGSRQAPLYYVSGGQINVELPAELTTSQQVILVSANNAFTLPDLLDINPLQAGIAAYTDGTNNVIAQHADFSYVTASHPAKASETIIIYLGGMGATNPAVPSGQGAPTMEPLARVVNPPTVTVDGQNAPVAFAGLAPGFVGLYQIDLQVPSNARSGSLALVVSQNGVAGNTTNLIVGQ